MEEAARQKFQEAVQEEVQRLLASRETLGLPEGKIELTPVAQKAIDGYLFKWLSRAGTLLAVLATVLGVFGFRNISAVEMRVDRDAKSVAETAGKASTLLKGFETDLGISQNQLTTLSNETKDVYETAVNETERAADVFKSRIKDAEDSIEDLNKKLGIEFSELRSKSNTFTSEMATVRAEWEAVDVVKQLQGVADTIANDPRILEFVQNQMTLNAMPVGSIVGWHKNFPGAPPNPPDGWVECSGMPSREQYDWLEGSTIDLSEVPNLNDPNKPGFINGYGGGAFLRGSTASGVFERDSTKIPNAAFTTGSTEGGHNHTVPGGDTGSPIDSVLQNGGNGRRFSIAVGGGNHGHRIMGGGDPETRPVNMSVVWIIRVK